MSILGLLGKAGTAAGNIGAIGGAAKGIIGLFQNRKKQEQKEDERQLKQQERLQALQIKGQKELTEYGANLQMNNQMAMFNNTGYEAQRKQLEAAGLNAGLLYGHSGGGGQSVGGGVSAGSVSGGSAADAATTQQSGIAAQRQIMELSMMKAQMDNINADTKQKEAAADKTAGVDTENVIADTAIKQATTEIQNVAARVANKTESDQITAITYAANEQVEKAREQFNKSQIAQETQQSEINRIKQTGQNEILNAAAIRQGIKLDKAKIEEITANINNMLENIRVREGDQQVSKENMEKLTEAMLWGAGINAAGNIVNSIIDLRTGKISNTISESVKHGNKTTTTTTSKRK